MSRKLLEDPIFTFYFTFISFIVFFVLFFFHSDFRLIKFRSISFIADRGKKLEYFSLFLFLSICHIFEYSREFD